MKFTRRDALHIIISGAVAGSVFTLLKVTGAKALPRPPGSLIENEFLKFCTRCYRCIDVCPADALKPAGIFDGIVNIGTPVLDWKKCIFCLECIRTCPTGAIARIPKDEIDIGNAVINRDTCLAWTDKRRCKNCYRACKYEAIELEDRKNPVVIEAKCTGCGACEGQCPTDPKSIIVNYDKDRRFDAPEKLVAMRLEDRVGPYEYPPPGFKTWLAERIKKLARYHGIIE
ncbi:MAG: 4Fe-4S dicluster domain-containing protein [Deltaproteobacteria bacterium]|nr:4Fe-4S dicluster domain-containing protein [Deltaproteobacteria bacterium]